MTQPDRTQAPPFRLSADYRLAQPEVFTFSGGQPLYAFRDLQQNVIKLELVFQAGKWYESKSGISYFTPHMLPKGTKERNSFQIADALDSLGAHLEIIAGFDTVSISIFVLKKNFFASLDIILELLRTPVFDENELRQEKEVFMQNLRVNNEKPSVIASKEIRKTIFGPTHPYGNSTEESDVQAIDAVDLMNFFRNNFNLHSAYLIGRVTDGDINQLVDAIAQPPPTTREIKYPVALAGVSHRVAKPGSVQSSIRLAKKCIPKGNKPAYFDAVMFNHVFGGFFGSRLMKNIREEKGLTYGIHSAMNHFLNDSFWVISAEVNQQHAEQAIQEIKKELQALQEVPISREELEVAKNYFIGSWQSDNNTLFAVAEKVKNIHSYGLPDDYYTSLLGHLNQITPGQIQQVANTHFGMEDLVEIQVG